MAGPVPAITCLILTVTMPIAENCKLCFKEEELQESHILPSFVYKWLKETSATGYLRFGQAPNKRVQDGYKEYWLCRQCEQRLNVWETQFAKHVFYPISEDGDVKVPYSDWLLKFCTSVSWRTLLMMKEKDHLNKFSDAHRVAVDAALSKWAAYLLDKAPNPGLFEQHLIIFDVERTTLHGVPANFNRYILRTVDLDVVRSNSILFVLSKMGKFFVLGFIDVPYRRQWVGTKINAQFGIIKNSGYKLPRQFGDYLIQEARRYAQIHAKISEAQRDRIDETMWRDIDRLARSGSLAAMRHDVQMAGKAAFDIHGRNRRLK
jgi:hypothetical protein